MKTKLSIQERRFRHVYTYFLKLHAVLLLHGLLFCVALCYMVF